MGNQDKPDDDISLFQQAMADVNRNHRNYRINQTGRVPGTPESKKSVPPRRAPPLRTRPPAPVAIDNTDQGDSVLFARAGFQRQRIRRLKRGEIACQSVLDLHGLRAREASESITEFIHESAREGCDCVLIIHGKGYHSENRQGVLKPLTINWLKTSPLVMAFCSAAPGDGGTGAVYVLLKKSKPL